MAKRAPAAKKKTKSKPAAKADWRADTLARIRALINQTDPALIREAVALNTSK